MSDIIKLLADHVANQIAAGEVIQRPSSVVKELLENAIDAGCTQIKLILRDGGKTFIQIIDNGKGMSPSDARMCWERHATSKINAVEDIFHIRTMGFRGEALASIASVAMVELKTKRPEDKLGTYIRIEGSEVKTQEGTATVDGTSITVKNLFYNIPARRNFLKSDAVETRHIIDEFMRVAIANPEIAMSMFQNDNETFILQSGDLSLRIRELFSYNEQEQILPVSEQTTIVNLNGFVGKPEFAKKTRGEQYFFVNKRFIKDAYLNHALIACYDQLIQKDQFPFYVLMIDIDPSQIDVNVHPTKTEIKFEDERAVYQIIRAVCKKAIGQHYHIPTYEPSSPDSFLNLSKPPSEQIGHAPSGGSHPSNYGGGSLFKPAEKRDWQQLFEVLQHPQTIGDVPSDENRGPANQPEIGLGVETQKRNILQVHNSILIVQVKSGIMLIHQQAAHERILFEKYMESGRSGIPGQQRLFPKSIQLQPADIKIMEELIPDFRLLGFEINSLGKETFSINAIPPEIQHVDEQEMIMGLIEQYKQQSYAEFQPYERLTRILSKRLAIQPGKSLSPEEMVVLTDELFACKEPQYAPDGTRCIRMISLEELFQLLKG